MSDEREKLADKLEHVSMLHPDHRQGLLCIADFILAREAEKDSKIEKLLNLIDGMERDGMEDIKDNKELKKRISDLEAQVEKLRKGIEYAIQYSNGRWCEWGERAKKCLDILEEALHLTPKPCEPTDENSKHWWWLDDEKEGAE